VRSPFCSEPRKPEGQLPVGAFQSQGVMTSVSVGQVEVEELLKSFAVLGANDHPLDWERFYRFVASSHRHGIGWNAREVQSRLEDLGLSARAAGDLAEIYWHARCVMHRYDNPGAPKATYADWMEEGAIPLT
jgi:hypothetical protein